MAEVPHLVEVQNRFARKGVQVIGVTGSQSGEIAAFARQRLINYPILTGGHGDAAAYGIRCVGTRRAFGLLRDLADSGDRCARKRSSCGWLRYPSVFPRKTSRANNAFRHTDTNPTESRYRGCRVQSLIQTSFKGRRSAETQNYS